MMKCFKKFENWSMLSMHNWMRKVVDLQSPQEYHTHLECTPIMDQCVSKFPQQPAIGLILLFHLCFLDCLVHNEELLDVLMWMKVP